MLQHLINLVPIGWSEGIAVALVIAGLWLTVMPGPRSRVLKILVALGFLAAGTIGYASQVHEQQDADQREGQHDRDVGKLNARISGLSQTVTRQNGLLAEQHNMIAAIYASDTKKAATSPVALAPQTPPLPATTPLSHPSHSVAVPSAPHTKPSALVSASPLQVTPNGRSLTDAQIATLEANLISLKGQTVGILTAWDASDAEQYARQFLAVFRRVGIQSGPEYLERGMFSTQPPPLSIDCYTPPPINAKAPEIQEALALRGAFIAAGLIDTTSKITLLPKDLLGKTHFVALVIGPQAAEQ
jgi:hypothetical protein